MASSMVPDVSARSTEQEDALDMMVYPEEGVKLAELSAAIRGLKIPNVKWSATFNEVEVAYGIIALRVVALMHEVKLVPTETGDVEDAICALRGAAGEALVKSVSFEAFNSVDA